MSEPVDNSVPYPFYAALKEENRRLAEEYVELKDLYLKCRIDIGNLHKENERLRKAGDAIAETARRTAYVSPRLLDEWDEARGFSR